MWSVGIVVSVGGERGYVLGAEVNPNGITRNSYVPY